MNDIFKSAAEKIRIEIWVLILYVLSIYIFYIDDSDVKMVYNYVNQFEFMSKLLNYDFTFFMIKMVCIIIFVYTISIFFASIFVLAYYPETKNKIKIKIKSILNKINFLNDKSSDNFNNDLCNIEKIMDDIRNLVNKYYQVRESVNSNLYTIQEFEEISAKLFNEINAKNIILDQCNKEREMQSKERKIQGKQFISIANRVNKFFSFEKTTSDLVFLSYITLLLFSIVYRYGILAQKIEFQSISIILTVILVQFFFVQFFSFLGNSLNSKSTSTIKDNK